jgi:hypothetical protein
MTGFLTPLMVELIDHIANNGQGEWYLIAPLTFIDKEQTRWTVPVGFTTDFASVPRVPFAFWIYGCRAHAPAVLHDWACRTNACPREKADELFLEAMESTGMKPSHAGAMYRAVAGHTRNLAAKLNPWSNHES